MAADTSPTLTSTSHTLTGAPVMAPPPLSTASGDILALLEALRPDNRHTFLQPSAAIPNESLNLVKSTLEAFAAQVGDEQQRRLKESRKRKRGGGGGEGEVLKTRKVYVDGFDTNQVWQQAKKIINGVLSHSEAILAELEDQGEIAANGEVNGDQRKILEFDPEGFEVGTSDEDDEDVEEASDDDQQLQEEDVDDDEDDEEIMQDEEGGALLEDEEDELEGDEDEDAEEEEEYVEDPNGLNDGFFSIDDFNRQTQWFEEQDARGDPNTDQASEDEEIDWDADPMASAAEKPGSSNKKTPQEDDIANGMDDEESEEEEDGPTFGNMDLDAPEGDSEDEADGLALDDEGDDQMANGVYYKDFFAPPPRKNRGGKPRKNVHFERPQPAQADIERAMADVRRDLFEDESDNDDSEDALSDVSAGDPKSRRSAHERRQAKLADEIRKLEAASVAKREWTLSGEAAAVDRPMNSLLEEDLDFEHVGKPVPVITPEVSEGIEDLIKRRILAQEFDEVIRRRPDSEGVPSGTRRGLVELDDSKATKGLAEIYEEEHVRNANPDSYVSASDAKLQREEKEIEALWKDVSGRLDTLSSWRYKPKPAAPSLSVVSDVAAIAMEDAQPATAAGVASGSGSRMAPQEIYSASASDAAKRGEVVAADGLPVARQEMSREDKARRRRQGKERVRKAGGADAVQANGKQKVVGAREKARRETLADLKKGGVKVINRKGEVTDVQGNKAKAEKKVTSGSYKL